MRANYEYDSPYWDEISQSAKDFIRSLIEVDPKRRYTCDQALSHPWICGDTAKTTDISSSVSEQMKKNAARLNWKKAIKVVSAIAKMKQLTIEHSNSQSGDPSSSSSGPGED